MIDPGPVVISVKADGGVVVVLGGEIDLANADSLETQIGDAIASAQEVVIDLTAVEFLDSRGLRLLRRISAAVVGRHGTVEVVAPPGSIARSVLDMTRMSDELAVRDALPAAQD